MIGNLIRLSLLAYAWSLVIPVISNAAECQVTFGFTDQVSASGILVDVSYPSNGGFVGAGDEVICHSNVPGGLATFNNKTADGVLTSALIRIDSFSGRDLLSCAWTGAAVSAADFEVVTLDATDSALETIEPLPTMAATEVICDGVTTTDDGTSGAAPAGEGGCYMVVSAASSSAISGLMFDVHYQGAGVDVAGVADGVDCYTLVPGGLGAYNDKEDEGKLTAAVVSIQGFTGYNDVVECYVDTYGEPSADALEVVILDAVDPAGAPIVPVPEVDVRFTDCSWDETGIDPAGGGDPTVEPATGECIGGAYDVTFGTPVVAELGSLQFSVDYTGASGGFDGSGDGVACEVVAPGNGHFASFNDQDDLRRLLGGLVSVSGVQAPADVVRCRFEADGSAPSAADFVLAVTDASTPDVQMITPMPTLVVTSITPSADNDCWADCGNGVVDGGEQCDDGNDSNADSCRNDCTANVCGDGVVAAEVEDCDDGNADDTDACLSDCMANVCGDGHLYAGVEECDDGDLNSDTTANACRSNCYLPACGDGVADAGEACDDGNDDNTDSCLEGCVAAFCGDGFVNVAVEDCDSGVLNNDADPDSCRTDCTWPLLCGDVDGSGAVTATDSRRVLESSIGLSDDCDGKLCDVDGNARVSASDAQLVLGYAVGIDIELQCMLPVIVSVESDQSIGALQFTIDYSATGSTFMGDGADVYCVSLVEDGSGLVSFNNEVGTSQLHVGIVSVGAIVGPIDLLACSFYPTGNEISADAFGVDVTDATDSDVNPIELDSVAIAVRFE